ncbi:Y-family DNA polymerase [Aerococcus urinae]|uniref:Y-family DNA polymerase n=1 Tax=Aerococcus urinae TaxID=1376 RepID=A0A0X8FEX0_9LACT|nr:Y-family DNA polymerase [Aerococcus urinae]AMB96059.1 excinuclease ABC subunit A [Aerococcus urinae]MCY3033361.1 Y-family DNA polymerase [Aerococcus urinae]MCY3038553.1 Y-family DNA polymerase [Aerococcus urinae]MCY3045327.1 Y-family DNA polymerase [Aerococcus urinae]MCY3047059.1 Y-family DNA polymerase [Aerococcus urinae]
MKRYNYDFDYSKEPKHDILCIDMKSFFASVECVARQLDPLTAELVVMSRGEANGGLVLAATPTVKAKYGLKTGSRLFEFPRHHNIQIVPPNMSQYIEINLDINEIFLNYVAPEDLHIYSIDESFLDVSYSHKLFGSNEAIARQIQADVYQAFGITATVGIGDNLLLAKLCLDNSAKKTPPYIDYWSYESIPETVWKIDPLRDFWGIAKGLERRLNQLGIYSVDDLAHADVYLLQKRLGIIGVELFEHANGIDHSIIRDKYVPSSRSFGKSQILQRDYTDPSQVAIIIREMGNDIAARLRQHHLLAGQVSLSIGYSHEVVDRGFRHQVPIDPTDRPEDLNAAWVELFRLYYEDRQPIRQIALSASKFQEKVGIQLSLFEDPERTLQKERLYDTMQKIHDHYGPSSLFYANSLVEGATGLERNKLIGGHQA